MPPNRGTPRGLRSLADVDAHDSIDEGDELLFLLLPLDEVSFDQRLQLRQVLLLALPVDVLSHTNTINKAENWRGYSRLQATHVKVDFFPIGYLRCADVGHEPEEEDQFMKIRRLTDLKGKKPTPDTYFCLGFDSSGMKSMIGMEKEAFLKR